MSRKCTICTHPQRDEIDRALVEGIPKRRIAADFKVSESALRRHERNHLPKRLVQAHAAKEAARADDLLARARAYEAKAVALLKQAEAEGDYNTALRGIREARAGLELLARMRGELESQVRVNILELPEWQIVREVIYQALRPYPEAREAVREGLLRVIKQMEGKA